MNCQQMNTFENESSTLQIDHPRIFVLFHLDGLHSERLLCYCHKEEEKHV